MAIAATTVAAVSGPVFVGADNAAAVIGAADAANSVVDDTAMVGGAVLTISAAVVGTVAIIAAVGHIAVAVSIADAAVISVACYYSYCCGCCCFLFCY